MTYLRSHRIPLLVPNSVSHHIVHFCEEEKENNKHVNNDQMCVASMVQWLVRCQVDVCSNNIPKLDTHYEHVNRDVQDHDQRSYCYKLQLRWIEYARSLSW